MSYQIKLEIFEGPMDLLLHLIKKHELDIYSIPIALITQQYLEYIELMKSLDMEIAGDFLVMASTLTHIKSRMLLPPPENPETTRTASTRGRSSSGGCWNTRASRRPRARSAARKRPGPRSIPARPRPRPTCRPRTSPCSSTFISSTCWPRSRTSWPGCRTAKFEITAETVSITEKISQILARLETVDSMLFADLFEGSTSKLQVIGTFLALLELIKTRVVKAFQIEQFGAIRIMKAVTDGQKDEDTATGNLFG